MTTKLIKKLSYLKETTNQIKEALIQKGALIDEATPLRQYVKEIGSLKTQKNTKFALSSRPLKEKERAFIVPHFDASLKNKNGSLSGSFNGYFTTLTTSASFCYDTHLIMTKNSGYNNWRTFQIDKENQMFTPHIQKTESLIKDIVIPNPVQKKCIGGFYFQETDTNGYPTGTISYPSDGYNTSFNRSNMLWDSSGTYLVNLDSKTQGVDVLKLIQNEDNTFTYELVQKIDTSLMEDNSRTHAYAPADLNTPNSFCLFGRYIYQIDPATNALSMVDVGQLSLPVTGVILLYGKNYLVLKSDDTSTNPTITFLKATPLDETLAEQESFFQNPSNYTFEILHQEGYENVPTKPLFPSNGGYFSPITNVKDYFIRPLKEKISSLQDFEFCFTREASLTADETGLFYDEETFLSQGGKSETDYPVLYKKNPTTLLFEKEEVALPLRTYFLSEHGGGAFNHIEDTKEYFFKEGVLDTTTATTGTNRFYYETYLKNGTYTGYVSSGYQFSGKMFRTSTNSLSMHSSCCNIVNDEMISNLSSDQLYKIEDTGVFTTYTAEGKSYKTLYSFAIEKEGELFAIYAPTRGVDIEGELYKLTLHPETKTFTSEYVCPIKYTQERYYWHVARKLKTAPLLITTWGYCYGFYSGASDGVLRFVERQLPEAIYNYVSQCSVSYIQTFYDGSVALHQSNGRTLHFFLTWDEEMGTVSIKEGTQLDVFDPIEMAGEKLNTFFSPFKRYQFVRGSSVAQIRLSPFQNEAPKESDTAYHLESITTNNLSIYPTATTCQATGKTKTLPCGALLVEMETDF